MRRHLMISAAAAALAGFGTPGAFAQPQDGDQSGTNEFNFIHPYKGDINPFTGDINPFRGDINPFRGDINPFYGDISPFWGDISPFWGDIDPFFGDINPFRGDISPFWGDINPFKGDINPFWDDISPFWEETGPAWGELNSQWMDAQSGDGDYSAIAASLSGLLNDASAIFADAVQEMTGMTLEEAFLNDLLDRFGIDLSNPDSLADVSAAERSEFFLTLYDQLMSYSGFDHVDHWMPAINWSPALAHRYDEGRSAVVGVLDFGVNDVGAGSFRGQLGNREDLGVNHGDAVASLIGAPIDGQGTMGVAPHASMRFYNPFDESRTSDWASVADGVESLARGGASVINMSLGVPGWTLHQEWANVFAQPGVARHSGNLTFVVAAGNDGLAQSVDLDWTGVPVVDNLIIVGSVGPAGGISSFSNTPGEACLTMRGACPDGHRLMDRFLVAPGELLLVSDGNGGVTRATGTSFAAPLVAGAAALVKGWWQWLDGGEVADVLLDSAQDLGEPGTDPVYGRGLLDVAGAMSPIDPDALYALDERGNRVAANDLVITGDRLNLRSVRNGRVFVFEDIGGSYRDFGMELSDLTEGSTLAENIADRYAEQYIYDRSVANFTGTAFSDRALHTRTLSDQGDLRVTAQATRLDPIDPGMARSLGFQMSVRLDDRSSGRSLEFGLGEGALALTGRAGFGLYSDFRPETGGVNPVLGLASGGVYGTSRYTLSDNTDVSFGLSTTYEQDIYLMPGTGEELAVAPGIEPYQAGALHVNVRHRVSDRMSLNASLTQLHEATGLLGTQGASVLAMEGGADTSALTVGLETRPVERLSVNASLTAARTRTTGFSGDTLRIADAIGSTAAQASIQLDRVFGDSDGLRVSLVQPLHVESGALEYTGMHVVDRETGELGLQSQTWELGGERAVYAEFIYATRLGSDRAAMSLFAREQVSGSAQETLEFSQASAGLRLHLKF